MQALSLSAFVHVQQLKPRRFPQPELHIYIQMYIYIYIIYFLCFKNLVYPPDNKDKSSSRIGVHGLNSGSQSAFGHWPGCTMVSGVVKLVGRLKLGIPSGKLT